MLIQFGVCGCSESNWVSVISKPGLYANLIVDPHLWLQLAGKYDPRKEEELRLWIEDVTGRRIEGHFMESLKDGVLLCE